MIVEGGISVKACMLGGKRHVECVYLDKSRHDKDAHFIERKAGELGIEVKKMSREELNAMVTGKTHGGVAAEVSARQYQEPEDALLGNPFVVVLEGVEDPFNLGYVMRTVYTAGATGLVLRKRDWSNVESVICKSSAGASEYLNVILSDDLPSCVKRYREKGLHCYAAMRKDAVSYFEGDYTEPCLLAIGGEMRGLSSKLMQEIQTNIYIPYANDFRAALNAAGASAALAFEVMRQRQNA